MGKITILEHALWQTLGRKQGSSHGIKENKNTTKLQNFLDEHKINYITHLRNVMYK